MKTVWSLILDKRATVFGVSLQYVQYLQREYGKSVEHIADRLKLNKHSDLLFGWRRSGLTSDQNLYSHTCCPKLVLSDARVAACVLPGDIGDF